MEDQRCSAIVDTGARNSLISSELATELGNKIVPNRISLIGPVGNFMVTRGLMKAAVKIGDLVAEDEFVVQGLYPEVTLQLWDSSEKTSAGVNPWKRYSRGLWVVRLHTKNVIEYGEFGQFLIDQSHHHSILPWGTPIHPPRCLTCCVIITLNALSDQERCIIVSQDCDDYYQCCSNTLLVIISVVVPLYYYIDVLIKLKICLSAKLPFANSLSTRDNLISKSTV